MFIIGTYVYKTIKVQYIALYRIVSGFILILIHAHRFRNLRKAISYLQILRSYQCNCSKYIYLPTETNAAILSIPSKIQIAVSERTFNDQKTLYFRSQYH